jgi:penicillin-binding protein-related factor A (putative recombinase)
LAYLTAQPGVLAWKNSSTGVMYQGRWLSKTGYSIKGVSDILGVYQGKFFAIEVKTPEAYKKRYCNLSQDQLAFMKRVHACGGMAYVVDNLQAVVMWFDQIKVKHDQ